MIDIRNTKFPLRNKQLTLVLVLGVFLFSGIFGFLYETGFYIVNNGVLTRRGTCYGPWIQLYSYGGLLLLVSCWRLRKKPWLVFLTGGLVSGILELVVGWALYHFGNGFRSWDYNTEIWNWGNIGGFVCLRSVLFFAASSVFLIYIIVPALLWASQRLKPRTLLLLIGIPTAILLLDAFYNDIVVSFTGWPGALVFYRDTGWYGIVSGVEAVSHP